MPTTPTLTIVDNEDNTGAVATIAGSTALSSNVVFTMAVDGALGTGTFTNSGNRVADGTVALSLTKGFYWAYIKSSLSGSDAVSTPVYFVVTDGEDAVFNQILIAIQAGIQGLLLEGVENTSIKIVKVSLDRWLGSIAEASQDENIIPCPAIYICPVKEKMDRLAGPIGYNEVQYGAMVAQIRIDNQEPTLIDKLSELLLQRQLTTQKFFNQLLTGVSAVTQTWVDPGELLPFAAYKNNYLIDFFTVRCEAWLERP